MSKQRYSLEFKEEAVRQIVDRGYSVTDVAERLGVLAHSLYKWVKAVKPSHGSPPGGCGSAGSRRELRSSSGRTADASPQDQGVTWLQGAAPDQRSTLDRHPE